MKLRNKAQSLLRKTSSKLLNLEAKLEPTAEDDLIHLLKTADIPTPILLSTLDFLQAKLEELEADNA